MKRSIKFIAITLSALVFLTACSSNVKTKVENSDEIFAEVKGTTITKGDVYDFIKLKYGVNLVSSHLVDMELDKYVTLDEEDTKKAEEALAKTKETLKDQFDLLIMSQGFKDEKDYFDNFVLKSIKIEKLFNIYLDENLETVIKEFNTSKVRILNAESKADAEEALKSLQELEAITGESFEEIAKTYDVNSGEAVIENIYKDREENTFLNTKLKDAKAGLYEEVIMTDDGFAILYIDELNVEEDKDLILESFTTNEVIAKQLSNEMYLYFAKIGNFEIHDTRLKELFQENNPFQNKDN